jgi:hypothetical protein
MLLTTIPVPPLRMQPLNPDSLPHLNSVSFHVGPLSATEQPADRGLKAQIGDPSAASEGFQPSQSRVGTAAGGGAGSESPGKGVADSPSKGGSRQGRSRGKDGRDDYFKTTGSFQVREECPHSRIAHSSTRCAAVTNSAPLPFSFLGSPAAVIAAIDGIAAWRKSSGGRGRESWPCTRRRSGSREPEELPSAAEFGK